MSRGPYPLFSLRPFDEAGVYALYYIGSLPLYAGLRSSDATQPIYAGKASPPGARTGATVARDMRTQDLYGRLQEHAASTRAAEIRANANGVPGIRLNDFVCRYLVTIPLWVTQAERLLIESYKPLWNSRILPGFGLHNPGKRRYTGTRSWWDTLHPGRSWADKLSDMERNGTPRTLERAIERVNVFMGASEANTESLVEGPSEDDLEDATTVVDQSGDSDSNA